MNKEVYNQAISILLKIENKVDETVKFLEEKYKEDSAEGYGLG